MLLEVKQCVEKVAGKRENGDCEVEVGGKWRKLESRNRWQFEEYSYAQFPR